MMKLWGIVEPVPEYGDVGPPRGAYIGPHAYLLCGWGHPLWWGETEDGAPLLLCPLCRRLIDERRVA